MEFSFNLTRLFGSQIPESFYKIDKDLQISSSSRRDIESRQQLSRVIDDLGTASAKAQRLSGAITMASKLAYTDQRVYLLVDCFGENGSAIGFIKIGTKKLFLYDRNGMQRECNPLCVLDFYVHESRQRKGYGKRIYQHMIQCEGMNPIHLAVDRPSDKFTSFLAKHYHLKATIPQVNNYVIFEGFFSSSSESKNRRSHLQSKVSDERITCSPAEVSRNRSANQKTRSAKHQLVSSQLTPARKPSPAEELRSLEALSNIPINRPSSNEMLIEMRNGSPVTEAITTSDRLTKEMKLTGLQDQSLAARTTSGYSRYPTIPSNGLTTVAANHSAALRSQTLSKIDSRAPSRTRETTSHDSYNTHQSVLDRQGHLKVTPPREDRLESRLKESPEKQSSASVAVVSAQEWVRTFHHGPASKPSSAWNIFGVPAGYTNIVNRRH